MKLEKQDIGIWVKESDEQPPYGSYHIRYKEVVQFASYKYDDNKFICDTDESVVIYDCGNVEWLKPLTQVYVLTEDELHDILNAKEIKVSLTKNNQ